MKLAAVLRTMKPIDFRNETFASLQHRIAGSRAAVYAAWAQHGPGTTEEVCARWTPDPRAILSFRPRTTELYQLGFIACTEEECPSPLHSHSRGARYRALTHAESMQRHAAAQALARGDGVQLGLRL